MADTRLRAEVLTMGIIRAVTAGASVILVVAVFAAVPPHADAHRSGCHRWHSCPSDTGSYVCGDLGYCSQCPDNRYCLAGQPRPAVAPTPESSPEEAAVARTRATIVRVVGGDTVDIKVAGSSGSGSLASINRLDMDAVSQR